PQDIYHNKLPQVAASILAQMKERGLLPREESAVLNDLSDLAKMHEDDFFHYYAATGRCNAETLCEYRGQYKLMLATLPHVEAETLTQDVYLALQYSVCETALSTARNMQSWKPGDAAPPSAQKRLYLLYRLLDYLKHVENCPMPLIPCPYQGRVTNTQQLLELMEDVRIYPDRLLAAFSGLCAQASEPANLLLAVMLDTGLRLGEALGLLWGSLCCIDGSQGPLYYLQVTGQMDTGTHLRKELTKTESGYRTVPLSSEIGARLATRKAELAHRCGDVDLVLMLAREQGGVLLQTAQVAAQCETALSALFRAGVKQSDALSILKARRPFLFNATEQDAALERSMTLHSMRRNSCTQLHTEGGLVSAEIDLQMGHVSQKKKRTAAAARGAKTQQEQYTVCMQKKVSKTPFRGQETLCYTVHSGARQRQTEVPACRIQLTLQPGDCAEIFIQSTEPHNKISYDAAAMEVTTLPQSLLPTAPPIGSCVRASEAANRILAVSYPFGKVPKNQA
ncbi:MAG: hypothetical protein RR194_03105, partial [Ruthenibacterium sp.]